MQLPLLWPVSVSTRALTSRGIGFLETLKNPANLFKNNLNNIRNKTISNLKKRMVELYNTNIFIKKASHERTKKGGEVALNLRTNDDQIMPRFERNFIINDKCIIQ